MKGERDQGRGPQNVQKRRVTRLLKEPQVTRISDLTDVSVGLPSTRKSDLFRDHDAKAGDGKGDETKGYPGSSEQKARGSNTSQEKEAIVDSSGNDKGNGGHGVPTANGEFGKNADAPLTPEVRGFIAQLDTIMLRPEYNNPIPSMQLAIELWRMGKISSLSQFEKGLREMDSKVHFIAMPKEALNEKWAFVPVNEWEELMHEAQVPAQMNKYQVVYPPNITVEGEPGYWLWVGVNGSEEAAKMRERLGVTEEENAQRLKTTGVLSLPSENNK